MGEQILYIFEQKGQSYREQILEDVDSNSINYKQIAVLLAQINLLSDDAIEKYSHGYEEFMKLLVEIAESMSLESDEKSAVERMSKIL